MPQPNPPDGASEEAVPDERPRIRSARDAARLLKHIAAAEQEQFYVLGLDTKHRVVVTHCAGIGTVNHVQLALRDVFRELVRHNCVAFIAVHNHPCGDPYPSPGDLQLTIDVQLVGKLLGIGLMDHIVLAAQCFYSTRDEALYPLGD